MVSYSLFFYHHKHVNVKGTETVQVTPLSRTLVSSP